MHAVPRLTLSLSLSLYRFFFPVLNCGPRSPLMYPTVGDPLQLSVITEVTEHCDGGEMFFTRMRAECPSVVRPSISHLDRSLGRRHRVISRKINGLCHGYQLIIHGQTVPCFMCKSFFQVARY